MTIEAGSISHGTMNERDLIPAFLGELERHDPGRWANIVNEYADVITAAMDSDPTESYGDQIGYLMETLFDALDELAPEGMYFGAIEGDGSDYGFWASDYLDEDDEDEDFGPAVNSFLDGVMPTIG